MASRVAPAWPSLCRNAHRRRGHAIVASEPDAYPTLALKGAALLHSIAGNHALVDGNKRLAWLATAVFLDLNGHRPDLTSDAAFDLVMDVAEGKADVEEIANRLKILE
jgi:death on curing protein